MNVPGRPRTRPPEHPLLVSRATDLIVTAVLVLLTATIFIAMATDAGQAWIQKIDDRFLDWMVTIQSPFLTAVAKVFSVMGGALVTLPVRLGVAGFLAWRRRWWHFAAFVSAMVVSEIAISILKNAYDRARPPNPLVVTTGASFPSGHAVATSVTVIAIGIALFPPRGVHRMAVGHRWCDLLLPDGPLPDLPARPLAVRRGGRGPARATIAMVCAWWSRRSATRRRETRPGSATPRRSVEPGVTQPAEA